MKRSCRGGGVFGTGRVRNRLGCTIQERRRAVCRERLGVADPTLGQFQSLILCGLRTKRTILASGGSVHVCASNGRGFRTLVRRVGHTGGCVRMRCCVVEGSRI